MPKALVIPRALLAFLLLAFAQPAAAAEATLPDHALGKADAPITMEEYVSMTCSHCADYYLNVLPQIKEQYVDTGKVRVILKDFPTDGEALKAAVLARCMPGDQYFAFVAVIFKNQTQWAFGTRSPEDTLVQFAKLGGLPEDKAKACLKDAAMMDAVAKERNDALEAYSIEGTPAFVIRGGNDKDPQQLTGAQKFEEFAAIFDRRLAPAVTDDKKPGTETPDAKAAEPATKKP